MEGLKKFVSSFEDGDRTGTERRKDEGNAVPVTPREATRTTAALPFSIEGILSGTKCSTDLEKDLNSKQDTRSHPLASSLFSLVTGKF